MTSEKSYSVESRLNTLITGDTWHTLSLQNGWTNGPVNYRFSMDGRKVVLSALNLVPGTTTDATQICAVLPAGPPSYRPATNKTVAASTDVVGARSASFTITTGGAIQCHGIAAAATAISIEEEFALDL